MRIISRLRWNYMAAVAAIALGALSWQWLLAQPPSSPPGPSTGAGASSAFGGAASPAGALPALGAAEQAGYASPGNQFLASEGSELGTTGLGLNPEREFTILDRDEQGQQYSASRVFFYSMEPGAAKPKRMAIDVNAGGFSGEMGAMSAMGGGYGAMMGSLDGMQPGGADAQDSKSWPIMYALVSVDSQDGTEASAKLTRATIEVAVSAPHGPVGEAAMMGMGGMSGSPGMEMGSRGPWGSILITMDTQELNLIKRLPGALKTIAPQERANIAQLIRLDVWIEDARTALRTTRNDEKAFAATESHLKQLLREEYDALLAKQRADAERLRKRLERLQADLERRAQAKDRVVDVQLGKLVLEAQGLLDTQR